ncbi:MAG: Mrp/NBP35 family ATP-binding protein [Nitrospirae bacterium]|nr:Mrp/NBP35 family ATP-binding protein [Nitrospirota bacterium]
MKQGKSEGRTITEVVKDLEAQQKKNKVVNPVLQQVLEQVAAVQTRMGRIKHKIAVMSGKGGVGKSSVTVNLANSFTARGYKVGILDVDLSGPCSPKMMGIRERSLKITAEGALPAVGLNGIKVASMELMLPSEGSPVMWKGLWEDSAVWRGTVEMSVIREFISDVNWGPLDLLLIDMPPASSDKPPIISQMIPDLDGAVIVTIPSEISQFIVKKSVVFLNRELHIPILGLIENMSGAVCPHCGEALELFEDASHGESPLQKMGLPLLGRVPFDRRIAGCADKGRSFVDEHPLTPAAQAFRIITDSLQQHIESRRAS